MKHPSNRTDASSRVGERVNDGRSSDGLCEERGRSEVSGDSVTSTSMAGTSSASASLFVAAAVATTTDFSNRIQRSDSSSAQSAEEVGGVGARKGSDPSVKAPVA